jgi:hypothetical protein
MREEAYRQWLRRQQLQDNTINAQMYRAARVDQYCGGLDEHYERDGMTSLIQLLTYSTDDERRSRPNPTPMPIEGNIRNNLASYRDAAKRYRTFRESTAEGVGPTLEVASPEAAAVIEEEMGQRIGLERDMQRALRNQIGQLEQGLIIIDEGAERAVDSGFIDITAQDAAGNTVVIELKAGPAGQRAVAQILSYMGDIQVEEDGKVPRGILVASDFDSKSKAAARVVPTLVLRKYSVQFTFSDGHA